jgi:hypothetical protein
MTINEKEKFITSITFPIPVLIVAIINLFVLREKDSRFHLRGPSADRKSFNQINCSMPNRAFICNFSML